MDKIVVVFKGLFGWESTLCVPRRFPRVLSFGTGVRVSPSRNAQLTERETVVPGRKIARTATCRRPTVRCRLGVTVAYGKLTREVSPPPAVGTLLNLGPDCANCTAHAGAVQAYLEVKETTNDFAVEKEMVNSTGHQFSVTGHGFGGMLSIIASLDQGWRGQIKWSHNHG